MVKKQIVNFVGKFLCKDRFKVQYVSNTICEGAPASVDTDHIIYINRAHFPTLPRVDQKCILLHEIGHIINKASSCCSSDSELEAHETAIMLAWFTGMKKEEKHLDILIRSWNGYSWNEDHGMWRCHIKASRKYIKKYGDKHE